jgi:hypothetical protein
MTAAAAPPGRADAALREHGLDGERLLKIAHAVAQHELRTRTHHIGDRYDDLVSFLTEQGLNAAITYNPALSGHGYTFASYIFDVMARRVPDFFRRKSEGYGDRRYGNDNRVALTDTVDDPDPDADFDRILSERQLLRYQQAARIRGTGLEEWVRITLDIAATQALRDAA